MWSPLTSWVIDILLVMAAGAMVVLALLLLRYRRAAKGAQDRFRRLDERVEQRTLELLETNRLLLQEIDNRKAMEESLRKSEAIARGMFETAVDAIITINSRGIIASFNPAAERLFGYGACETIGKNVSMLMPQPYRREHDGYLQRFLTTRQAHIIGVGREVIGRRKDGSTFPMDLAVGAQILGEQRIFTGFVRDLTERKRLEAEILDIAEREQQRIGQDLHDGLGQHLTGVAFLAKGLAGRLAAQGRAEAADAEKINDLVNYAVSQTRALSHGLQPLEDAGELAVALERLCESVRQVFCIDCSVHVGPIPSLGDLTIATHLFRIAQEAVHNAVRHGKARCIAMSLREVDGHLRLMVQDDGGGFGPVSGTGIGLRIMHHRARTMGATLDVRPGPSAGAVVTCDLELTVLTESPL